MSEQTSNRPITGFGDVPFRIEVDLTWGTLPEFTHSAQLVTRHVPGGNVHVTQMLGMSRRRVTYHIWCDTRRDYADLLSRLGETDTLTLVEGATSVPGTTFAQHGGVYLSIPNVLLVALADVSIWIDGEVEAQATFEVDYA